MNVSEWRPNKAARGFCWIVVALSGSGFSASWVWGFISIVEGDFRDFGFAALASVFCALPAAIAWRWGLHPLVRITAEGVLVRNPFRARFMNWDAIARAEAGYSGVTIHDRDGGSMTAWAVQKSNTATWLKRRVRADELVDAINRSAGAPS